VAAAVDLQEHALAGVADATLTVSRWASTARCGDTGAGLDASHRGARQEHALVLGQHLGEVVLVEANVGGRRQLDDARCQVGGERVGRRTAAVPVDERFDTAVAVRSAHASQLSHGDAQQQCRLLGRPEPAPPRRSGWPAGVARTSSR